jgi:hypothetical protein
MLAQRPVVQSVFAVPGTVVAFHVLSSLRSAPIVRQRLAATLNATSQEHVRRSRRQKGRYTSFYFDVTQASILTSRDEFLTSDPIKCKLLILRCLTRFE